jgi:endonuclease YncB( thermonuclease family)
MPYSDLRHVFDEKKPQEKQERKKSNTPLIVKLLLLLIIAAISYWYSQMGAKPNSKQEEGAYNASNSCDKNSSKVCGLIIAKNCKLLPCPLEEAEFANHCEAKKVEALSIKEGNCTIPAKEETTEQQVRIVDGDTFDLSGTRIRLYGIDAVELNQHCFDQDAQSWPCGIEAKKRLSELLNAKDIQCKELTKDIYGRSIASCTTNAGDIAKNMVSDGYAVAYRKYSSEYIEAEQQAKKEKKGIWKGRFVFPNKWRKAQHKMN